MGGAPVSPIVFCENDSVQCGMRAAIQAVHYGPDPITPAWNAYVAAHSLDRVGGLMQCVTCRTWQLLSATFSFLLLGGCHKAAPPLPPPLAVDTTAASIQTVPVMGSWVATLDGMVDAEIQPQVGGYVIRQDYKEGAVVRRGQVLFEIDPRPWQAVEDQASGSLAQAKAQYNLATINVVRDTPLVQAHAYAQSSLDTELGTQAADKAAVESAEATLESAKLNVGFTKVRSLVDGVAGQAAIQVGNLVSTTSQLVEVSQLNPIKVYFFVSEQEYMSLSARAQAMGNTDLLSTGQTLPLRLTLADNQTYPKKGHVISVDRAVSTQTGSIRIAASFANPGNVLRPSQFGTVSAQTDVLRNVVLIPQKAVTELQGLYQVVVVRAVLRVPRPLRKQVAFVK